MGFSRRQHWTSWIGIALILFNVLSPLFAQSLRAADSAPTVVAGLPMEICSAGMPTPAGDGQSDEGTVAMGCCILCSHASQAMALPSADQTAGLLPRPFDGYVRTSRTWIPRSSFPLQVRPQPPPVLTQA